MESDSPFDLMAEEYAKNSSTGVYNAMYERPALLSFLPDLAGKRVLDAGCGSGTLSQELLDRGATITGVDISEKLLQIARRDYGESIEFFQADLSKPLDMIQENSFDIIVSSLALHYIEDWKMLFDNLATVLRPDGQIVFSTHHPAASRRWFDLSDYFKRKLVSDVWQVGGKDIIVKNYHRSLTEMFDAFISNNFVVTKLLEPQPLSEVKEIAPVTYHRLSTREHFILFRLKHLI